MVKSAGLRPTLRDSFYVIHDKAVEPDAPPAAPAPVKSEGPRRLVIQDGE